MVKIQRVSSDKVQAFDDYGRQLLDTTFNNELIEGLPFGINICLDYAVASTTTDKYRMAQLKNTEFKLDFVIAAGIRLNAKTIKMLQRYSTPFIMMVFKEVIKIHIKSNMSILVMFRKFL